MPSPPRLVCPLCGHDEGVNAVPLGPGLWEFTCTGGSRHVEPFNWQTTAAKDSVDEEWMGGKSEELGLYDDLPQCFNGGDPWVEYGVVEYRYSQQRPRVYAELLGEYGHTRIGRKSYTTSSFIAGALGRLAKAGILAAQFGPRLGIGPTTRLFRIRPFYPLRKRTAASHGSSGRPLTASTPRSDR